MTVIPRSKCPRVEPPGFRVNNKQWSRVRVLFRREHQRVARRRLTAALWVRLGGNPWRELPHDLGKWQTVYKWWRRQVEHGVWPEALSLLGLRETPPWKVRLRVMIERMILDGKSSRTIADELHVSKTTALAIARRMKKEQATRK